MKNGLVTDFVAYLDECWPYRDVEYTERTKAEQIANAYFDMGAGWSASGGLLKELREMEDGYIKQLADAQATIAALQDTIIQMGGQAAVLAKDAMAAKEQIAALQARVRELEEITKVICGHCCEPMEIPSKAVLQSALTQRTAERDTARRRVDELEAREVDVVLLREDLEQRTAELEAVNKHQQLHDRIFVGQRDLMAHYVATIREAIRRLGNSTHSKEQPEPYESRTPVIAAFLGQALGVAAEEAERERVNLQAELERVRADNKALDEWRADVTVSLQRPGGAFFVDVPQHIKDLVKERDDLRTLILALPKVEGEISERFCTGSYYSSPYDYRSHVTFETALVALLKHRQGMEG